VVAFIEEILDDLVRVERKANDTAVDCGRGQEILERARGVLARERRRGFAVTDRVRTKGKIPRGFGECPDELEIRKVAWTAKVLGNDSYHGLRVRVDRRS